MDPPETTKVPIGQVLLVAAALGKSLGTLLGPTAATKMVYEYQDSVAGEADGPARARVTALRCTTGSGTAMLLRAFCWIAPPTFCSVYGVQECPLPVKYPSLSMDGFAALSWKAAVDWSTRPPVSSTIDNTK